MKKCWIVTGVIVVSAAVFGIWEDRRFDEATRRHERAVVKAAEARTAAEGAEVRRKREELAVFLENNQRSATELMDWLRAIDEQEKKDGSAAEAEMDEMLERLALLTSQEVAFVLDEYMKGNGLKGGNGVLLFNACMMKLASDAPVAAVHFYERFAKKWKDWGTLKDLAPQLMGDSLIAMAKQDPAKAAEWLKTRGKDFDQVISEHSKRVMLFHVAKENPGKALSLIGELGMSQPGDAVVSVVRSARTEEERLAILAAFRVYEGRLSDDGTRREVMGKGLAAFAEGLSEGGPEDASRWLAAGKFSVAEMEDFVKGVAEINRLAEPDRWVEWIGKTVSPEVADGPVRKLFSRWTEENYDASGKWLVAMPKGPVREMAVQAYAETTSKQDPETAAQWAETLPNGGRRTATMRKIFENWPAEDVEAARAFAKRNGIE